MFDVVLTSQLSRAVETCALAGFGDRAEVVDDLREWDYGKYEGRTTADIRTERPGWLLWRDGVPGGEPVDDVGRRADRVIARLREGEGAALVVAHGHLLRILTARWLGLAPADGRLFALDPATMSVLGWEREVAVIERWNQLP
jgi:broad specificity phosphatase PhoE